MKKPSLKGLKVLVTAGPTREYFDPVRFLSNPSSGKMGYAIAEESARRGARVTLISGPTALPLPPSPVRLIRVVSAQEMYRAVMKASPKADLIIMAAAVSDFRPARYSRRKIKKRKGEPAARPYMIGLVPTQDILMELGRQKSRGEPAARPYLVGFAAETNHLVRHAAEKLRHKNLNLIVANRVGTNRGGFEGNRNRAIFLSSDGRKKSTALMTKKKLASELLNFINLIISN